MRVLDVGGSVRDELMGLVPHDFDKLVLGATPEMMIRLGFRPVGKDFPVFLHPETNEEYALARQERKIGKGHRGFETRFSPDVTLEDDLSRRDLTINAMAKDPVTGEVFDPFGGRRDLSERVLRHVSDAFSEDPLRVLRLARFQAKTGFSIHPGTFALAAELCSNGALQELSFERVRAELAKLAQEPCAALAMRSLAQMGALDALAPGWSARLDQRALDVLDQACRSDLPLMAKMALLPGPMPPKDAQRLLERLRFSVDEQRFCSRLMAARQIALDDQRPPGAQSAIEMIEKAGLAKASGSEALALWRCLDLLLPDGPPARAAALARAALGPYQNADLSAATRLPEGSKQEGSEIGRRVAAARLHSVSQALAAAARAPSRKP